MSTRSRIGLVMPGGIIMSVYCHHDGYLSHMGKMLFEHYADFDKVHELINLGDLSSVYAQVAPPEGQKHSFNAPCPNVTVAYRRDRGESSGEAVEHLSGHYFLAAAQSSGAEYAYLFEDGTWYVWEIWDNKPSKQRLESALTADAMVGDE